MRRHAGFRVLEFHPEVVWLLKRGWHYLPLDPVDVRVHMYVVACRECCAASEALSVSSQSTYVSMQSNR